ncbi:Lrp/AsnC family transcriptional regulator [Rhizohabitans arisaemae]|uniref:Lrp/AsnC family transcriptional regulator n=1 Tax=Rhizohabitans arisaemae TaxID=2720610 RepID=UPI0024B0AE84|nr:Lrp/AsnC family transcriptional regulator [Rhizohabitans arisaemae]
MADSRRRRRPDKLDTRLLRLLRDHPREGLLEIARRLGVARGTAQARLDHMVSAGIVTDFGPSLSPRALGYPVEAFTVLEVEQLSRASISSVLTGIPELLEAHIITGPGDIWCRIAGRDHADLQRTVDRILAVPGVRRSTTVISLSTVVPHRVLPLAESLTADPDDSRDRDGPGGP